MSHCSRFNILLHVVFLMVLSLRSIAAVDKVEKWAKFEHIFTSDEEYGNPLYDLKKFSVKFTSPSGRIVTINGFWDGGLDWKVRFLPNEKGLWSWVSNCSDTTNRGLHKVQGSFVCEENTSRKAIYRHGAIVHPNGSYHLSHADGTPFFWAGCTAWNGALRSTDEEWEVYLNNRAANGYSVIQFVTTQWRGCDRNSLGQVAFEGSGRIKINPDFFRHLDGKIDRINAHGLVAAPVLLWALATVQGRELSPGYYLPEEEAILLARYMVARYGGNHVVWILAGDGKYTGENEQRWKNIGRGVFTEEHPGLVALHPGGTSWIGEAYANEAWLDIIGYQSGHSKGRHSVNFMTKGPMASMWMRLPARPIINMEPVYEEIHEGISAKDIRNAGYWSILNAPTAGFTYGANGIWPWLREGEVILNHGMKGEKSARWYDALSLPGSTQIAYLSNFVRSIEWWKLRPAPYLLVKQPGDESPADFVSVSQSTDGATIVVYAPRPQPLKLHRHNNAKYDAIRYNPVSNNTTKVKLLVEGPTLNVAAPVGGEDFLLILRRRE